MMLGGSPNPALWSVISETTTDIGNTLLLNDEWDHQTIFDPISNQIENALSLPDSVKFHQSRDLAVQLPPNDRGKIDIFIDDSIGVALDLGSTPIRVNQAIPLAIRTLARPLSEKVVIPRKDIISLKKLQAEGRLEETKTILGWVINTRLLQISLPDQKFLAWSQDIDSMITAEKSSYQWLETLLGHLNHVACIFIPMRHFLG